MIVRAALPLVAEYGSKVTTSQIARAAGIGEATIFRVFPDKETLLDACVVDALDPSLVLGELASISLDQPLAVRLTEAGDAMRAHLDRMGAVIGALHASGYHRHGMRGGRRAPDPAATEAPDPAATEAPATGDTRTADEGRLDRGGSFGATRDAIAELFEPDQAALRLPAAQLADLFMRLLMPPRHRPPGGAPAIDLDELVHVFLHGALAPATP
jgi:AcrR family transcriptional regulator